MFNERDNTPEVRTTVKSGDRAPRLIGRGAIDNVRVLDVVSRVRGANDDVFDYEREIDTTIANIKRVFEAAIAKEIAEGTADTGEEDMETQLARIRSILE